MAARPGGAMNPYPPIGRYEPGFIPRPNAGAPGYTSTGRKKKPSTEPEVPQNEAGRKVDGNFYGHLKAGSVKAGKIKGAC